MSESIAAAANLAPIPLPRPVPALHLPPAQVRGLQALARLAYPFEACGLLIGRTDLGRIEVVRVTRGPNLALDRRRDRYRLDPRHWLAAEFLAREDGLDVVGVWHTHPDHPPRPSRTDLEAAWPGLSYVILSVRSGTVPELAAWMLDGRRFVEQAVTGGGR